jgi:excisionase family DNA binding protein
MVTQKKKKGGAEMHPKSMELIRNQLRVFEERGLISSADSQRLEAALGSDENALSNLNRYVTARTFAILTGRHIRTVRRMIKRREIQAVRQGQRSIRIPESEVVRYLAGQPIGAGTTDSKT